MDNNTTAVPVTCILCQENIGNPRYYIDGDGPYCMSCQQSIIEARYYKMYRAVIERIHARADDHKAHLTQYGAQQLMRGDSIDGQRTIGKRDGIKAMQQIIREEVNRG